MYFSPISDIYNYYLAFGRTEGSEEYGTDLTYSDTSGVLAYQITHLQPNTTYFVKLRGSRGCKPGSWSNSVRFTTARSGSRLFDKDLISQVISTFSNSTAGARTPSKLGTTAKVKKLSSCSYTVKPGDSLWGIASRVLGNGTLYRKIIQLNKLPSDALNPGQKLKVC